MPEDGLSNVRTREALGTPDIRKNEIASCGPDPERSYAFRPASAKLAVGGDAAHSMTSSARARIDGGTVRPSASAVLRLTISSILLGCRIGNSPGFSPARMRPVYCPA